jgi:hypothetical protein
MFVWQVEMREVSARIDMVDDVLVVLHGLRLPQCEIYSDDLGNPTTTFQDSVRFIVDQ